MSSVLDLLPNEFLSSNTQDFIEVMGIVLRALIFDWDS